MIKPLRWVDGGLEVLCKECGQIHVVAKWSQPIICDCKNAGAALGSAPATEDKTASVVPSDDNSSKSDEET